MAESSEDKISRLRAMTWENGTWDLSPNDIAAIQHGLRMIDALADELAKMTGKTLREERDRVTRIVEKGQ